MKGDIHLFRQNITQTLPYVNVHNSWCLLCSEAEVDSMAANNRMKKEEEFLFFIFLSYFSVIFPSAKYLYKTVYFQWN